ncbi:FkbM family methyltransferase [Sulfurospirillum cavolei]|uniref:FkbM family methyltransferase n=1 Tax=Sulfurospirillum cavolei TaxID=366522 RepID=UPI0005A95D2D|nr:FkbM family methyltransferase [Sulfurospirillum cavolei]
MIKKWFKTIIPKQIRDYLIEFKNNYFNEYATRSYAQEGEDMVLNRLFAHQTNGFYVDVGAHHPKRFSNTYLFYRKGWCGINIDAMPNSMKVFDKMRPRDINIEAPVSDTNQELTYYVFNDPALNGFSETLTQKREDEGVYFVTSKIPLQTYTLKEIFDTNLPSGQKIDFLSIDVEGWDFKVLKSNDFLTHCPKVVLVEVLETDVMRLSDNEIVKFMMNLDYKVYAKTVNTVFFVHRIYFEEVKNK